MFLCHENHVSVSALIRIECVIKIKMPLAEVSQEEANVEKQIFKQQIEFNFEFGKANKTPISFQTVQIQYYKSVN